MNRKINRYYRSEAQLSEILITLKLSPCPHCKLIGALILHGFLYGNEEGASDNNRHIRGRRIICNGRKKHNKGCGQTFSIKAANTIRNVCITAQSLWSFLTDILMEHSKASAFIKLTDRIHPSSAYRLYKRFSKGQSRIRSFLSRLDPRPKLPTTSCATTQTIAHLKSVFATDPCPITAFQMHFQVSFL